MGANYYLKIKSTTKTFDRYSKNGGFEKDDLNNGYTKLTNGYLFQNTYYPTLEELDKHFYITYHIGKNSYGWRFLLATYPELGINSLDSWKKIFKLGRIEDEDGNSISSEEMINIITKKEFSSSQTNSTSNKLNVHPHAIYSSPTETYDIVDHYDFS